MSDTRKLLSEIAFAGQGGLPPRESDAFARLVLELSYPVRQAYEDNMMDSDPVVAALAKLEELLNARGMLRASQKNDLIELVNHVAEEVGFEVEWEFYDFPEDFKLQ